MRRVRYYEYGEPEVLRIEEVAEPDPGPGQARIRMEAIGGSYVDTAMRRGISPMGQPPLPGTPHGDVVGTVDAVGAGVEPGLVGQRVAALAEDAYADAVLVDAAWLTPVPPGMDSGPATALGMPATVAAGILRVAALRAGETVLVNAAAGGIGHLLVQVAKLAGAGTVVATAGSPAKLDFVREYGADVALSYADGDWPEQVRAAVPDGIDVFVDSVGGQATAEGMGLLGPFGRVVVYGAASGELPVVDQESLYRLRVATGFSLYAWRQARPAEVRAAMAEMAEHAAAGRLRVAVQATVPLAEAAQAHRLLEDRGRLGRVVITP